MYKKCQVYTPVDYVNQLLNSVNYTIDLYGKKFLENSCGEGNILIATVERYIEDCKKNKINLEQIRIGLERDIYGYEIDPHSHKICIENLNKLLSKKNIGVVHWKIFNKDFLMDDLNEKFDFVVGNPPYITYKELKIKDRKYLKEHFKSCSQGKFDYCYAFIEKSIMCLSNIGKMSYLIPSSIFKTVFGEHLRDLMKGYITIINDYTTKNVFDDALVKSAIIVLNCRRNNSCLIYNEMLTNKEIHLELSDLNDKWVFSDYHFTGHRRFGDYFKVSHVVATLLNKVYVIKNWSDNDNYIQVDKYSIEKEIIRETATPRSIKYDKHELIIFPYFYDENNKLVRYRESELKDKYPKVYKYLSDCRSELDMRKKEKHVNWFEYGRSQALCSLNSEKLLISTVVTDKINVYEISEDCIPYGGLYIVPIQDELSLSDAIKILESDDFLSYVLSIGIHISGSSVRITSKDIMEYRF